MLGIESNSEGMMTDITEEDGNVEEDMLRSYTGEEYPEDSIDDEQMQGISGESDTAETPIENEAHESDQNASQTSTDTQPSQASNDTQTSQTSSFDEHAVQWRDRLEKSSEKADNTTIRNKLYNKVKDDVGTLKVFIRVIGTNTPDTHPTSILIITFSRRYPFRWMTRDRTLRHL